MGTRVVVLPSPSLYGRQFRIRRLRSEELDESGDIPSHQIKLGEMDDEGNSPHSSAPQPRNSHVAAVRMDQVATTQPPRPTRHQGGNRQSEKDGVLSRLWKALTGNTESSVQSPKNRPRPAQKEKGDSPRPSRSGRNDNRARGQNRKPST